jgi:hypothetical protein
VHATYFGEFRGFVFERQRRIMTEQFVFRAHDLGQFRFGDDSVIIDGLEGKAPRVGGG